MKHLLYTTIGYGRDYISLLDLFLKSLTQNHKTVYTICIMCDTDFINEVQRICQNYSRFPYILFTQPNAKTPYEASMYKVHIFDLPNIDEFTNIFYVDLDCLFLCAPDMFLELTLEPNILYVGDDLVYKKITLNPHNNIMWSLHNYTEEELRKLKENKVEPFNAGCFLFQNTPSMRRDFESVCEMMRTWKGNFFYEQSFMNVYFNKKGNTNRTLLNTERYVMFPNLEKKYSNCIVHFCGSAGNGKEKYTKMELYWKRYAQKKSCVMFGNRNIMMSHLITSKSLVLEIGVFKGDFSEVLYNAKPQTLFLVDPWTLHAPKISSGDADGNHVKEFYTDDAYNLVKKKFEDKSNVYVLQDFSSTIAKRFADFSLDLIYLDGDHSYEGVKRDLELFYPKLVPGGWMCGHKYEMNMKKANTICDFGVRRAVDEFCQANGLQIQCKAFDGYVSFAFQKK